MQMGVYHSPASVPLPASPTPSQSSPALAYSASFIDSPPFPIVEQRVNGSAKPDNDGGWQTVKPRPPKPPLAHPLAAHIPAYKPPECVIWEIKREGQGKAGGRVIRLGWEGRATSASLVLGDQLHPRMEVVETILESRSSSAGGGGVSR